MRVFLLYLVVTLSCLFTAIGQSDSTLKWFDEQISGLNLFVNGRAYSYQFLSETHPFLQSARFDSGIVVFDDLGTFETALNYDVFRQALIQRAEKDGLAVYHILQESRIIQFEISGRKFQNTEIEDGLQFLEVLYEGERLSVFAFSKKVEAVSSLNALYYELEVELLFYYNEQYYPFQKTREVFEIIFSDKKRRRIFWREIRSMREIGDIRSVAGVIEVMRLIEKRI